MKTKTLGALAAVVWLLACWAWLLLLPQVVWKEQKAAAEPAVTVVTKQDKSIIDPDLKGGVLIGDPVVVNTIMFRAGVGAVRGAAEMPGVDIDRQQ